MIEDEAALVAKVTDDEIALIAKVTMAVRAADRAFESSGGSSRHWLRECFLPALREAGLTIVRDKGNK